MFVFFLARKLRNCAVRYVNKDVEGTMCFKVILRKRKRGEIVRRKKDVEAA